MGIAGAAIGAGVLSAGAGIISSSNAASAQKQAAAQANALQAQMYQQTRADLSPYNTAGQGALNALTNALGTSAPGSAPSANWDAYLQQNPDVQASYNALPASVKASAFPNADAYAQFHYQKYGQSEGRALPPAAPSAGGLPTGYLTQPFSMTQANLEQTPGYQFNLSQGLKSVNNALGARGLLNSGAVMKGASTYATGLADSTYQNQFNMDQTQKQNIYNRLSGVAGLGENAAAQVGNYGTQTAANQAQTTIGAGNASAAASIAAGNAISGAGSSAVNGLLMNKLLSGSGLSSMYSGTGAPSAAFNSAFSGNYLGG